MAITRAKKEELVAQYVAQLNDSKAVIIAEYRGLTVRELQQLRAKIREAEGKFFIVKNTLARRAMAEAGLPISEDMLSGPIGFGFCPYNVTSVAKAMTSFAKDQDLLVIKGGLMGTKLIDPAAVRNLADLPPLDVLRAQLLGLINSPASQLAGVVAGGVRQVVNVLNAYAEKGSEEASAEA